jgi:hypothetical protein
MAIFPQREKTPDEKLFSFMSEIFAVIHSDDLGYKNITAILPDKLPRPDYQAEFGGVRVRIEVRTLREPQDIVRTVAVKFWNERRKADPNKYNFSVTVTCPSTWKGPPGSADGHPRVRGDIKFSR